MKKIIDIKLITIDIVLIVTILSIVLLYSLYDTLVFRVAVMQKEFAAVVSLSIVYLSSICLFTGAKDRSAYILCLVLFLFCLIGFFPATFYKIRTGWLLSDSAGWFLLCSFILVLSTIHDHKDLEVIISAMVILLWLVGVAGYVWGERVNNRFEAPAIFTVVGLPLMLVYARSSFLVIIGAAIHFITGYLCIVSGNRTTLLIWGFFTGFSPLYWFVRNSCSFSGWHKNVILALIVVTCLLSFGYFSESAISIVQSTRIYKIFTNSSFLEREFDQSLLTRVDEVKDSWNYMKETNSNWRFFFGFGHGASFPAKLANRNPQNMSQLGMLHNIHFGPMLIFFRYGILGLLLYVIFFVKVLMSFISLMASPMSERYFNKLVITSIALSYLFSGMMRNEFANPLFLLVVAMILTQGYRNELKVRGNE